MLNPLYIKYASSKLGDIDANTVKTDLNNVIATAESSEICWYLSWLLRTKELLAVV